MIALTGPPSNRPSIPPPRPSISSRSSVLPEIIDLTISAGQAGTSQAPILLDSDDDDIVFQPRPAEERRRRKRQREGGRSRQTSIAPIDSPRRSRAPSSDKGIIFLTPSNILVPQAVQSSGDNVPGPRSVAPSPNRLHSVESSIQSTTSRSHPSRRLSVAAKDVTITKPFPPELAPTSSRTPSSSLSNPQLPTPEPSEGSSSSRLEISPSLPLPESPRCQPNELSKLFEIADYGKKGKGLRALVDIKPATVIIREEPFVKFQHEVLQHEIKAIYQSLPASKQRLFMSFSSSGVASSGVGYGDKLVAIAENNSLPMPLVSEGDEDDDNVTGGDDDTVDRDWGGICENICRVNHSCVPNAGWNWDARRGIMQLTAYADIVAGSEITACYVDAALLYSERRQQLLEKWEITCDCRRCRQNVISDQRMKLYSELRRDWPDTVSTNLTDQAFRAFAADRDKALDNLESIRGCLMQEEQVNLMAEVWEMECCVRASWMEKEKAEKAAKLATWYYRCTAGKRAARKSMVKSWSEDATSCEYWGILTDTATKKRKKKKTAAYPTPKFRIQ